MKQDSLLARVVLFLTSHTKTINDFHLHLHPPPAFHPPTGHSPVIYLSCILHQTIPAHPTHNRPLLPPVLTHSLTALGLDIVQTSHSTFPYSLAPDSKARCSLLVPAWRSLLPVSYLRTPQRWGVCAVVPIFPGTSFLCEHSSSEDLRTGRAAWLRHHGISLNPQTPANGFCCLLSLSLSLR